MVFSVILLDQLAKFWVLNSLKLGDSVPVIENVFHLTLVHNTGIAFGLFQNSQGLLFFLITVSLVFLAVIFQRMLSSYGGNSLLSRWGLALILGGAIGNWIDRIRFNAVIDFLDFRFWPVFNLADTSISVGVGLYFILLLRRKA